MDPASESQVLDLERLRRAADIGSAGAELIEAVAAAGLQGRGGAAFPTHVKMRSVAAAAASERVVVANGEEGEPASIKDRYLLLRRPQLVLEGLLLTAAAVDARRAILYLSEPELARSLEPLIAEVDAGAISLELYAVERRYVAGEETAAVRAISGGEPLPTAKPPRPFEAGVDGLPTLVSNVETLANVALIGERGASWFREAGTDLSPGTFLCTLTGAVISPGLYELPLGVGFGEAIETLGGGVVGEFAAALMGGYFGGIQAPAVRSTPMAYLDLAEHGSGLGCGAAHVIAADRCPVAVAARVLEFFAEESSKQCGVCVNGTKAMRDAVRSLAEGTADTETIERLRRWGATLPGRGACALLDGAALMAASLVDNFADLIERHLGRPCQRCAENSNAKPPGAVSLEAIKEATTI